MAPIVEYAVLGAHRAAVARHGEDWFDAIDYLLRTTEGTQRVFGLRTRGFLTDPPADHGDWSGYAPIATTLDLASVSYWSFDEVMWVGPDAWPCLAWSNADAVAPRAIETALGSIGRGTLWRGPDGRGLPTPADLGLAVPDHVTWHPFVATP